jgi:pimeloyl-ACP methyl ester carboxylesterase
VTPVQTVAARTTSPIDIARQDQARARQPDDKGEVIRDDGVRIFYERYGAGDPAIVFVPSWSIVHSRIWKAQIPYFSRRHRVVTFDPRGNGRSDRPATATAYAEEEMARDILAVMDAAGVERAVLVSLSRGAQRALIASSLAGERIVGHVFVSPSTWIGEGLGERGVDFERDDAPDIGWARFNASSWRRDYRGFLEFFFSECLTEPHSTKAIDDGVEWGLEIGPEALILSILGPEPDEAEARELCAGVRCPTLVIQGEADAVSGVGRGVGLAAAIPGARLLRIPGSGHLPSVRDPVRVNLAIADFVDRSVAR